jgi:anti-anti-sigma factor
MEIAQRPTGDALELVVKGRLDAYWADHLAKALEEAIRNGADRIRLNMAGVSYMSSVGIRVLLRCHKQLLSINGSFSISNPSEAVKSVLELAGLQQLLASTPSHVDAGAEAEQSGKGIEREGIRFDVFEEAAGGTLSCRIVGRPELLDGCRFGERDCRTARFSKDSFGVGLGAFGGSFDDCRGRFGEFLAAAGAAAYLPTDGTNVPDYLVSSGAFVPEVQVLYALIGSGSFSHLMRFDSKEGAAPLALSALTQACMEMSGADSVGMVVVAESAGLMGAALRRSPALGGSLGAPFAHPEIKDWLFFTPERAYARSLTLVVGVASRAPHQDLTHLLRPLGPQSSLSGHFHAAAFSYRPLQRGMLDLRTTVSALFEAETLQGVLHLLYDDREISGAGQSEFIRGACWTAPIAEILGAREVPSA